MPMRIEPKAIPSPCPLPRDRGRGSGRGCASSRDHLRLNLPPLAPQPAPVAPEPPERRQRAALDRQTGAEHHDVACEGRQEGPEELAKGLVVDPEEETVLDRVKVSHGGNAAPPLGQVAVPVLRD